MSFSVRPPSSSSAHPAYFSNSDIEIEEESLVPVEENLQPAFEFPVSAKGLCDYTLASRRGQTPLNRDFEMACVKQLTLIEWTENENRQKSSFLEFLICYMESSDEKIFVKLVLLMNLRTVFSTHSFIGKERCLQNLDTANSLVLSNHPNWSRFDPKIVDALIFWNFLPEDFSAHCLGTEVDSTHFLFPTGTEEYITGTYPWEETARLLLLAKQDPQALETYRFLPNQRDLSLVFNLISKTDDPRGVLLTYLNQQAPDPRVCLCLLISALPHLSQDLLNSVKELISAHESLLKLSTALHPIPKVPDSPISTLRFPSRVLQVVIEQSSNESGCLSTEAIYQGLIQLCRTTRAFSAMEEVIITAKKFRSSHSIDQLSERSIYLELVEMVMRDLPKASNLLVSLCLLQNAPIDPLRLLQCKMSKPNLEKYDRWIKFWSDKIHQNPLLVLEILKSSKFNESEKRTFVEIAFDSCETVEEKIALFHGCADLEFLPQGALSRIKTWIQAPNHSESDAEKIVEFLGELCRQGLQPLALRYLLNPLPLSILQKDSELSWQILQMATERAVRIVEKTPEGWLQCLIALPQKPSEQLRWIRSLFSREENLFADWLAFRRFVKGSLPNQLSLIEAKSSLIEEMGLLDKMHKLISKSPRDAFFILTHLLKIPENLKKEIPPFIKKILESDFAFVDGFFKAALQSERPLCLQEEVSNCLIEDCLSRPEAKRSDELPSWVVTSGMSDSMKVEWMKYRLKEAMDDRKAIQFVLNQKEKNLAFTLLFNLCFEKKRYDLFYTGFIEACEQNCVTERAATQLAVWAQQNLGEPHETKILGIIGELIRRDYQLRTIFSLFNALINSGSKNPEIPRQCWSFLQTHSQLPSQPLDLPDEKVLELLKTLFPFDENRFLQMISKLAKRADVLHEYLQIAKRLFGNVAVVQEICESSKTASTPDAPLANLALQHLNYKMMAPDELVAHLTNFRSLTPEVCKGMLEVALLSKHPSCHEFLDERLIEILIYLKQISELPADAIQTFIRTKSKLDLPFFEKLMRAQVVSPDGLWKIVQSKYNKREFIPIFKFSLLCLELVSLPAIDRFWKLQLGSISPKILEEVSGLPNLTDSLRTAIARLKPKQPEKKEKLIPSKEKSTVASRDEMVKLLQEIQHGDLSDFSSYTEKFDLYIQFLGESSYKRDIALQFFETLLMNDQANTVDPDWFLSRLKKFMSNGLIVQGGLIVKLAAMLNDQNKATEFLEQSIQVYLKDRNLNKKTLSTYLMYVWCSLVKGIQIGALNKTKNLVDLYESMRERLTFENNYVCLSTFQSCISEAIYSLDRENLNEEVLSIIQKFHSFFSKAYPINIKKIGWKSILPSVMKTGATTPSTLASHFPICIKNHVNILITESKINPQLAWQHLDELILFLQQDQEIFGACAIHTLSGIEGITDQWSSEQDLSLVIQRLSMLEGLYEKWAPGYLGGILEKLKGRK